MPRPRKCRRVGHAPIHTFYKPQGVALEGLTGVSLSVEGLEAIRLADAEGLDHDKAAQMMDISRPTFSRLLNEARSVVARALSNGWAIRIDGGNYRVATPAETFGGARCGGQNRSGCAERRRQRIMASKDHPPKK
jgi:predicted DNA-binding protein (UPF0251 family)